MVYFKMTLTVALANLLLICLQGVTAKPENCCTLAAQFYDPKTTKDVEQCTSTASDYGTLRWKCSKGDVVYNGNDLAHGIGQDQIAMHINADPQSKNLHFTVMMECTGKSGSLQRALPLHCPTLSTQQMAGLGPIFKEPCAGTPKVYSITPLDGYECSKLTLADAV